MCWSQEFVRSIGRVILAGGLCFYGVRAQDATTEHNEPERLTVYEPDVEHNQQEQVALSSSHESPAPQGEETHAKPTDAEEIVGIDTIDIDDPAGNWLFKRTFFEKSEIAYKKIKAKVNEIFESRMQFFVQRTELDRKVFDPLYLEAGFGRGEFEELLTDLMSFIDKQREEQGGLDAQELEFLATLRAQQQALQQLKIDIDGITKIDNTVDDAIAKLEEQISLSQQYDTQAFDAFTSIGHVLNDKKARELYFGVETYKDNVNAILGYIQNDFAQYFERLVTSAQEHAEVVRSSLAKLKAQGIDFKQQAQKLEDINKKFAEPQEESEEEPTRWWQWPFVALSAVWEGIKAIFHAIGGLFGRSSE